MWLLYPAGSGWRDMMCCLNKWNSFPMQETHNIWTIHQFLQTLLKCWVTSRWAAIFIAIFLYVQSIYGNQSIGNSFLTLQIARVIKAKKSLQCFALFAFLCLTAVKGSVFVSIKNSKTGSINCYIAHCRVIKHSNWRSKGIAELH